MTNEEKAKAYDEALEIAREWYNDPHITIGLKGNLEDMFPELKKSEDERVRKALIEFLKRFTYDRLENNGVNVKDAITWLEKQGENQKLDGTFVNVDDVREDFMNQIYSILDADATNDRANLIIDAFDNLPSITISNQYSQILANSAKTCEDKQQVEIDEEYKIGKWFTGLIPCWVDAPSTLQAAHNHHGENIVAIRLKNGVYRCCCVDNKEPTTFYLSEDTHLVEGWHNREDN